ncbi:MAG: transcription-repair coupling factor [Myxococcota bacterium]|nr:transcription-repair coupling factor [Myxococcota bacterium]
MPETWTGLPQGATAFAIAQLLRNEPQQAWVVAPDVAEAERLAAELAWHGCKVAYYPPNDTRPYEGLNPHPELPRERILALHKLARAQVQVVVSPARALALKTLSPQTLAGGGELRVGQQIEPADLAARLEALGYLPVKRVEDPGNLHHRGGETLDCWPPGLSEPVRIEWFDDEIERINTLDLDTLHSKEPLDTLELLPAREEVLGEDALSRARRLLRERCEALGYGEALRREVLEDARSGLRFSGMDAWLPAFQELVPPQSHAELRWIVLDHQACVDSVEQQWANLESAYAGMKRAERPLVTPQERYQGPQDIEDLFQDALRIEALAFDGARQRGFSANQDLRVSGGELAPIVGRLSQWLDEGWRVALVADSSSRAERMRQLFTPHGLSPEPSRQHDPEQWAPGKLLLLRGDLPRGFRSETQQLALITADEVFGAKHRVRHGAARRRRMGRDNAQIESFGQLSHGDLVVHERHGIGRYLGLDTLDLGSGPQDMVQLEYRGGATMYLPVFRLNQLYSYRHTGEGEVKLDKLGGETWIKRKAKVKAEVIKLAHELLELQARREVHGGHAYSGFSSRFRAFEEAFPYTETPDQQAAIDEVLEDLSMERPMDRLVVGDAGFGKTEVAMRAAFRVIEEGRQVALLCPTTVLAFQHSRTLQERMGPFGVKVGLLSRFGDAAQARALKAGLKSGEIDVVVGTTSILGRGVRFQDLGLVIVDEEHRFGVRQKEKLKKLRAEVDYLALSATPIPRTLHMAMSGIRGFSIISTPPRDRLPVRTLLGRFGPGRIREEILRELRRGGQVFFVHNRIQSIQSVARTIREAVPEAKLAIAHGQLPDAELETVLVDFVERRADVLLCTAIIESGIDMPNVNTIVVNQADRFGLAALYQLRGRVGRSHRRGYCTLLVDEGKRLTREAQERLRIIQENTRLGSGFSVASADLELRGAGNLLGDRQHGQIAAVGFETYMQLLEEAMDEAAGVAERARIEPDINIPRPAFIPEDYLPGVAERLRLYKRLSSGRDVAEVRDAMDWTEQEYGELPQPLLNLGRLLEIQARCRQLGILKVAWLQVRAVLVLHESHTLDTDRLSSLMQTMPKRVRRKGPETLEVSFTPQEANQPYLFLHWALDLLEGRGA